MLVFYSLFIQRKYLLKAYYVPDADPGTGKIKLIKIHMVPVLTQLKIYMERQMENKALGSIKWKCTDFKNIHFLKTRGEEIERQGPVLDWLRRGGLILH